MVAFGDNVTSIIALQDEGGGRQRRMGRGGKEGSKGSSYKVDIPINCTHSGGMVALRNSHLSKYL